MNNRTKIERSIEIAAHRGPDDRGIEYFRPALSDLRPGSTQVVGWSPGGLDSRSALVLGHLRLSIIDLTSAGHQPMHTVDQAYWITYNGEIYNYLELRTELEQSGVRFRSHTDTEVILEAYRKWGRNCVTRFVGMWSFVLLDTAVGTLFCSRDRFGIKPFYYVHENDCFAAASEIKQILELDIVPRVVHRSAAYDYLLSGSTDHRPETMFDRILRLQPGHNLVVELATGVVTISEYARIPTQINEEIAPADAARQFRQLFEQSIRLQMRSDVEIGSCLSGGLDSSSIVCLTREELRRSGNHSVQRTFSSHFDAPEANELKYQKLIVDTTGVNASYTRPTPLELVRDLPQLVWHQDEPFGSTSIFAQWSVYKLVHEQRVKVMLDGQGADEMLAGYVGLGWYYLRELVVKRNLHLLVQEVLAYAFRHRLDGLQILQAVPGLQWLSLMRPKPPSIQWFDPAFSSEYRETSEYIKNQQWKPFGEKELLNNTLAQLTWRNNLPTLLRYEDRNSMAFSVEARVPFLDHRLVEFVLQLPSRIKIRGAYTKRVMRDAMIGVIPEQTRLRISKLGFATPEQHWQSTILRPMIDRALSGDQLQGYVDAKAARQYLERLERAKLKDFTPWRWLNFALWRERFDLQHG